MQGKIGQCKLIRKCNTSNTFTQSASLWVSSSVGQLQASHAWLCRGDTNRAQAEVLVQEGAECCKEVVTSMHNLRKVQWMT